MKRLILGLGLALVVLIMHTGTGAAPTPRPDPSDPPTTGIPGADGMVIEVMDTWFVEMASPPLAEATGVNEARYLIDLKQEKQAFRAAAKQAGIRFTERYAYDVLWNGLSITVEPGDLLRLTQVPGVVAVYPVDTTSVPAPPAPLVPGSIRPEIMSAIRMTGVAEAQARGLTGAGVNVAIMDTGVDYNHPDLGGCFGPGCRVVGGHDFVGDGWSPGATPVPDDDPMDCYGHGTFVSGVLAADGALRGAAPGVTLRAYKVFGCSGNSTADVMLAAMERVLADGNQILSVSISHSHWPQYPTSRGEENLARRGIVVVNGGGNEGGTGLYSYSGPGPKVIGVGAVDNDHIHSPAFRVAGTLYGYQPMFYAQAPPTGGTRPLAAGGRACNADRPLPNVSGKVALIARGTCSYREKATNARNAGAVAALIYNNAPGLALGSLLEPSMDFPAASLAGEDGQALLALTPVNLTWTDESADPSYAFGGLASFFTAFGPDPTLTMRPDILAPGRFIQSTLPLAQGGYGTGDGTSYATPHVSGAVALLLEAMPHTPVPAVGTILKNNASPRATAWNPPNPILEVTHRQGAGLLDLVAALDATLRVEPSSLSLGETEHAPVTRSLTITNKGKSDVTCTLSHAPAFSSGPDTYSLMYYGRYAGATFTPPVLTIPAGGSATIEVTFTEPPTLPDRGLFGGFVVISPGDGGAAVRVPYAGLRGDYQSIPVLIPSYYMYGNPILRKNYTYGPNLPITISPRAGEKAVVLAHRDHAVRRLRLEIFDAVTGSAWGRVGEFPYLPRHWSRNNLTGYSWDGTDRDGRPVPPGDYVIRLSVQKALGDDANPAHWEVWNSPVVTVTD